MKRAVLIGINYIGTSNELQGCINDITTMKEHLVNDFGFCDKDIRFLTDTSQMKPTRDNIENSVKWLVDGAKKDDLLFFYYSGHGSSLPDKSSDESDGKDEILIPLDYEKKGYILDDWMFVEMVSKVPKGCCLYSFTDCCHSSTILDLNVVCKYIPELCGNTCSKVYNPDEWKSISTISVEKRPEVPGTIIHFSGCLDNQTSADAGFNGRAQGAMSKCLNDTINTRLDLIKQNKFSLMSMLKEINCRLTIEKFEQHSTLSVNPKEMLRANFCPI